MKIGFVLDDRLDSTDGVQQYVLTLGTWFVSQGHDVHYLVGQTERTDIDNVHSLTKNLSVRFNQNKLSIPLRARKKPIRTILEKEHFDVLHVQLPYSPQFAAKVINLAPQGTAIVGTFHILPYSYVETKGSKLLARVLRPSLQKFTTFLSVSPAAQKFAKEAFGIESEVVPNVVDVTKFRAVRKLTHDNITRVAFLGRLVPRKGAVELVQALSNVDPAILQNVEIRIGGTGSQKKNIETMIAKHKLEHAVRLIGYVDEEAKANFLGQSDISVFPSTGGESFGIVLLEAMAAGSGVVIGGDNPGYRSVLGDWPETLVDVKNSQQFARTLEYFISNPTERQRIHALQQKAVEAYNVPRVGQHILKIYKSAIENNSHKRHTKI